MRYSMSRCVCSHKSISSRTTTSEWRRDVLRHSRADTSGTLRAAATRCAASCGCERPTQFMYICSSARSRITSRTSAVLPVPGIPEMCRHPDELPCKLVSRNLCSLERSAQRPTSTSLRKSARACAYTEGVGVGGGVSRVLLRLVGVVYCADASRRFFGVEGGVTGLSAMRLRVRMAMASCVRTARSSARMAAGTCRMGAMFSLFSSRRVSSEPSDGDGGSSSIAAHTAVFAPAKLCAERPDTVAMGIGGRKRNSQRRAI